MRRARGHRRAGRYVGAIHRFARRYFAQEMDRLGLPPTAFPLIIRLLRHDDVSQDSLATDFLVDKGTVARTVARLEEAGFVTRTVDEDDRRVKRVRVTDRARELAPEVAASARAWGDKLLEGFTAGEREQALEYLQRMARNARQHFEGVTDPDADAAGD